MEITEKNKVFLLLDKFYVYKSYLFQFETLFI